LVIKVGYKYMQLDVYIRGCLYVFKIKTTKVNAPKVLSAE